MGRFKETLKYSIRLLRDESGAFPIALILGGLSMFMGIAGKATAAGVAKGQGKRQLFWEMMLQSSQKKAEEQWTEAQAKERIAIEKSKTEFLQEWKKIATESRFQTGTHPGPFFQAIRK